MITRWLDFIDSKKELNPLPRWVCAVLIPVYGFILLDAAFGVLGPWQ